VGAFEPDGTKKVPGEVAAKTAARGSGAWRGGRGSRSQVRRRHGGSRLGCRAGSRRREHRLRGCRGGSRRREDLRGSPTESFWDLLVAASRSAGASWAPGVVAEDPDAGCLGGGRGRSGSGGRSPGGLEWSRRLVDRAQGGWKGGGDLVGGSPGAWMTSNKKRGGCCGHPAGEKKIRGDLSRHLRGATLVCLPGTPSL